MIVPLKGWEIGCPECEFRGSSEDFDCSCAGECFCPKCGCKFLFEPKDYEEE